MDDYFVENGDLLQNKLGIDTAAALQEAEYKITAEESAQLLAEGFAPTVFDFALLKEVHRRLFDKIYDFAGNPRTVNITKSDSVLPFCYADFIERESQRIFNDLAAKQYLTGLDLNDFTVALAHLAADLNALHPFREGNGRSIRLFLMLLAKNAGYLIDYSEVSRDTILNADKHAFYNDLAPLREMYRQIVTPIS